MEIKHWENILADVSKLASGADTIHYTASTVVNETPLMLTYPGYGLSLFNRALNELNNAIKEQYKGLYVH